METRQVRLGDYCSITSSKRIFESEYVSEGIPFFRSKEIIEKEAGKTNSDAIFISKNRYYEIREKYGVPQPGDILLTSVGTLGVPYVIKESDLFYFKDGNLTWMRDFSPEMCSKYLYYWLRSNFGKQSLIQRAIGSSQSAITIDILKKYQLLLPQIKEQENIVTILSAYDELIEKNNRKIAILQEQAQELYKEWFVRFRFPGHETTKLTQSRLGKIPNNFAVVKATEVIDYYIGGGWGNDEEDSTFCKAAYVIRGTDFAAFMNGQIDSIPYRYHKETNLKARRLQPNDIIMEISGGTADQPVGRTAFVTKEKLGKFDAVAMCASFCKQIRCGDAISPVFFFFWLQFLYASRVLDVFQLQSTGISNFQFEFFLRKCDTILPSKELMWRFENAVNPILKCIDDLAEQNTNLTRQRDLLLPRLISGKLEVREQQACDIQIAKKQRVSFEEFASNLQYAARANQPLSEEDIKNLYEAFCDDTQDEEQN